jgi:hypothetical protein
MPLLFKDNPNYKLVGLNIDRYGSDYGSYVSPKGINFEQRALPDEFIKKSFKTFEVVKPIEVDTGIIAPAFNKPGLGIQHKLPKNIEILREKGFIKDVK